MFRPRPAESYRPRRWRRSVPRSRSGREGAARGSIGERDHGRRKDRENERPVRDFGYSGNRDAARLTTNGGGGMWMSSASQRSRGWQSTDSLRPGPVSPEHEKGEDGHHHKRGADFELR